MTALRRTARVLLLLALLPVVVVGCFDDEPEISGTRYVCETDSECLTGYFCKKIPGATAYCAPITELREVTYVSTGDTVATDPDATEPPPDAASDTSDDGTP